MRIKRFIAGFMACMVLGSCTATPALAAGVTETEEETLSVVVSENENTENTEMKDSAENITQEETSDTSAEEKPYDMVVAEDGTVTFRYGNYEWSFNPEKMAKDIGTVDVRDGSYLNLRDGSGTSYNVIGRLLPGAQVQVISEEDGWYQVTVPEQTGYVYGEYLDVVKSSSEDGMNAELMTMLVAMMADSMNGKSAELTPDGNLTLVDDIGPQTGAGQQFITLVTKAGNTFYLVIDRDDDGNENVHFMNLVDEADLFALMDEDAQTAYEKQQTTVTPEQDISEPEADQTEEPQKMPEQEQKNGKNGSWAALMLLVIAAVGGIGGFLYLNIQKKKKQKQAEKPDPDADYEDDDEYEIPEEVEDDENEDNEEDEAESDDLWDDENTDDIENESV